MGKPAGRNERERIFNTFGVGFIDWLDDVVLIRLGVD